MGFLSGGAPLLCSPSGRRPVALGHPPGVCGMRKFVTLSLAAAALAGAAGVAYAQAGEAPALTRAEVERRTSEAFARMDANDDGVLDREDRQDRPQAAFERLDADKSGALS